MSADGAAPVWSAWARETPVLASPATTYVRVALPPRVLGARGDIDDLRVVDDRGRDVPFADVGAARCETGPLDAMPTHEIAGRFETWTYPAPAPVGAATIRFGGTSVPYERTVTIESSNDGTSWDVVASATIARLGNGRTARDVAFVVDPARRLRAVVDNGDDVPVPGLRPTLLGARHAIVFFARRDRRYRLLTGNADASRARFDLGERLRARPVHTRPIRLGATRPNPAFVDARPIGERMSWPIDAVFGVLALTLASFAGAFLRMGRPHSHSDGGP